MAKSASKGAPDASQLITKRIAELNDWRGKMLERLRKLIHEAVPEITEEWKWDSPVFTLNGLVCSAGAFKDHVKLNFFKGASLKDPKGLFNAGLDAKTTRSIDFREGDKIDTAGLKELLRAAVTHNSTGGKGR
jgi:hypothetical protein